VLQVLQCIVKFVMPCNRLIAVMCCDKLLQFVKPGFVPGTPLNELIAPLIPHAIPVALVFGDPELDFMDVAQGAAVLDEFQRAGGIGVMEIVPESGHTPMIDRPKAFCEVITRVAVTDACSTPGT
jgi:hypothetical protein